MPKGSQKTSACKLASVVTGTEQKAEKPPQDQQQSSSSGGSNNESGSAHIEVSKWSGVALWALDIPVDNCAICRNHIMDLCIECQAHLTAGPTDECNVAWGVCLHVFHFHCISRWLKTRQVCPLDNSDWEFKKHGN